MDKNTPVSQISFVAFDFETTGLSSERDAIVEFGAVKFKDGKILGTFQALVDPGRPIPADAAAISGITDAMVQGQPTLAAVLPDFLKFIDGSVLMAHNAGFDLGFLRKACSQLNAPMPANMVLDTQTIARRSFPGQKSYSLQNLVAFLKFPPNTAHRALDDSQMCMKLFCACVDKKGFMGDCALGDVMD